MSDTDLTGHRHPEARGKVRVEDAGFVIEGRECEHGHVAAMAWLALSGKVE